MNELLLRRRVAAKSLPYDSEVTYLRGDGNAYIKTGILFTDNITVKSKMIFTNVASSGALFGYRFTETATAVGNMRWFFVYATNNKSGNNRGFGARFGSDNTTNSTNKVVPDWTANDVDFDGSHLIVNGSNWITISNKYQTSDYGEMYIFWANCEGYYSADINKSHHGVILFQIYDSGVLVRDYIPVRVGQVGCLYDRVSGRLFWNAANSGAFTFGNDK